jgi:hypothetical protein
MLYRWNGKLLVRAAFGGGLATAEACCCEAVPRCQLLTGDLICTLDAPGCEFDGQEITLIDRSLGTGDDWWSGADAIWLGECLSIELELTCNSITGMYELTVTQVSGSTPCELSSGTTEATVQTSSPFHLEFTNAITDVGGCECCDSYPAAFTFVIEEAP